MEARGGEGREGRGGREERRGGSGGQAPCFQGKDGPGVWARMGMGEAHASEGRGLRECGARRARRVLAWSVCARVCACPTCALHPPNTSMVVELSMVALCWVRGEGAGPRWVGEHQDCPEMEYTLSWASMPVALVPPKHINWSWPSQHRLWPCLRLWLCTARRSLLIIIVSTLQLAKCSLNDPHLGVGTRPLSGSCLQPTSGRDVSNVQRSLCNFLPCSMKKFSLLRMEPTGHETVHMHANTDLTAEYVDCRAHCYHSVACPCSGQGIWGEAPPCA